MKKILWVSRHQPTSSQIDALKVLFGDDMTLTLDKQPFSDARDIVKRFREGGYDEMVVVCPLSVLDILCKQGIKPLWSQSVEEEDPAKIEFRGARGQGFRFVEFRRVLGLEIKFGDV